MGNARNTTRTVFLNVYLKNCLNEKEQTTTEISLYETKTQLTLFCN